MEMIIRVLSAKFNLQATTSQDVSKQGSLQGIVSRHAKTLPLPIGSIFSVYVVSLWEYLVI